MVLSRLRQSVHTVSFRSAKVEMNDPQVGRVAAVPYLWPIRYPLDPATTVLLVIDMQKDFCSPGGFIDKIGYDIGATRETIPHIKSVLDTCRRLGFHVAFTRTSYRKDLSNCPLTWQWRSQRTEAPIGSVGPMGRLLVDGEEGWDIIPELYPFPGEVVINKCGRGAFYSTDLDLILREWGVTNVVLTGVTTDVCVHSTMREADDRGYDCLLLEDYTAATEPAGKAAAVQTIKTEGGVFGAVSNAEAFIRAVDG